MGRVYAVVSAKGGVGKTTTAANVAAALAAGGSSVAVVDADLGMANLGGVLGVSAGDATLHDVLAGDSEARSASSSRTTSGYVDVAEAIREGPHGMAVVPGSPDLDAFARADPKELRSVLEALRADYEYVLVDTGAGLSNDTVVPLTYVDEVLLVSTPTRDALGDTEKSRQVAERLDVVIAGAALTRADPSDADTDADIVAELLDADVDVLASIPDADAISEASEAGEPLTTFAPGSDAAAAFRSLAVRLTGADLGSESAPPEESTTADEPTVTEESVPETDPSPEAGSSLGREAREAPEGEAPAASDDVAQDEASGGVESDEAIEAVEDSERSESEESGDSEEIEDPKEPETVEPAEEDIVVAGSHDEDRRSDSVMPDEGSAEELPAAEETDEASATDSELDSAVAASADDSDDVGSVDDSDDAAAESADAEPLVEPADPDEIASTGTAEAEDAEDENSGVYTTALTDEGEPADERDDDGSDAAEDGLGGAESGTDAAVGDGEERDATEDDQIGDDGDETEYDGDGDAVAAGDAEGGDDVDEDDAEGPETGDGVADGDDDDGGKKGLFSRFFG